LCTLGTTPTRALHDHVHSPRVTVYYAVATTLRWHL
jgi:hypothetical protein